MGQTFLSAIPTGISPHQTAPIAPRSNGERAGSRLAADKNVCPADATDAYVMELKRPVNGAALGGYFAAAAVSNAAALFGTSQQEPSSHFCAELVISAATLVSLMPPAGASAFLAAVS